VALPCLTTRACHGPAAVRGREARWRRGGGAWGRRSACRGDGAGPAARGKVEVGTGPASPSEEDRGSPRGFAGRDEEEGGRIRAPPEVVGGGEEEEHGAAAARVEEMRPVLRHKAESRRSQSGGPRCCAVEEGAARGACHAVMRRRPQHGLGTAPRGG
jgi:hypothetical protein